MCGGAPEEGGVKAAAPRSTCTAVFTRLQSVHKTYMYTVSTYRIYSLVLTTVLHYTLHTQPSPQSHIREPNPACFCVEQKLNSVPPAHTLPCSGMQGKRANIREPPPQKEGSPALGHPGPLFSFFAKRFFVSSEFH